PVHALAEARAERCLQLLAGGALDAAEAAEPLQQHAPAAGTDAGELVEAADQRPLLPAPAVARDGETVRLVAHLLQHLQAGVLARQPQRLRPRRQVDL